MSTLLIRLEGPMQSWGDESAFGERRTMREPTKSGIIGLVASSLGYRRDDERLKTLLSLRFGVRIDREGVNVSEYDYQISRVACKNRGHYVSLKYGEYETEPSQSVLSKRYYLFDASFLCGLEGDERMLKDIAHALCHPMWPLFLGRRSCPPAKPIYVAIRDGSLEDALRTESLAQRSELRIRYCIEPIDADSRAFEQKDLPLSFDKRKRIYSKRKVIEGYWDYVDSCESEQDPLAIL
ncbi:MAG: type I-E CRISPR-associated protein Cas5/CasD [Clostridiales bacterium]|nr:type I-E CRISPR-associated protein Cas5/CasD [Clostridiales bacterium]